MKLEELEKYIEVKIIHKNTDYRNTSIPINKYTDIGIKECTSEDFKNRGDDQKRFNDLQ